jgi:hypothetical protein
MPQKSWFAAATARTTSASLQRGIRFRASPEYGSCVRRTRPRQHPAMPALGDAQAAGRDHMKPIAHILPCNGMPIVTISY